MTLKIDETGCIGEILTLLGVPYGLVTCKKNPVLRVNVKVPSFFYCCKVTIGQGILRGFQIIKVTFIISSCVVCINKAEISKIV